MQLINDMKSILLSILLFLCALPVFAQDEFYIKKAAMYMKWAADALDRARGRLSN